MYFHYQAFESLKLSFMKKIIKLSLLVLSFQCMQASESKNDEIVYQPKSLVELCLARKNQNCISLSEQYVQTIIDNIQSNQPFNKGLRNEILDNPEIAKHLRSHLNKKNVLNDTLSWDDLQTLEWLLQTGVDVNISDKDGWTPLLFAQTAEQTKLLLAAGANVHARDNDGWTPLHSAETAEQTEVLLAAGADVNAPDNDGCTPLHKARTAEQTRLLVAAGADVNAQNSWGCAPLHWAKTAEQTEILLAAGADVNAQNKYNYTPLHYYCHNRDYISWEQIKLIIFAGADENAKSGRLEKTPIEYLLERSTSSKYSIDIKKFNKIIEKRNEQLVNNKSDTVIKLLDR